MRNIPGRASSPGLGLLVLAFVNLIITPVPSLADPPDAAIIEQLIQKLGNPQFTERQSARNELAAVGEPALESLRKTAAASKDPEIRSRAGTLVQEIENRVYVEVRRFGGHTGLISGLALSGDGKQAVSGSYDGTVRVWDVETGKELRRWDAPGFFDGQRTGVHCLALSADGRLVLTGSWADVKVWETATGREVRRFVGHSAPINCVAFSTDGRRALSGANDCTIRFWDVDTGRELRRCQARNTLTGVAFLPDGRRALSSELDGQIAVRLWDMESGKELRGFPANGMHDLHAGVACSRDGRRALSGSWDRSMRLWDVETGKETRRFDIGSYVQDETFSADGRWVLAGGGHAGQWPGGAASPRNGGRGYGFVALYGAESGKQLHRFVTESIVLKLAISSNKRYALSGSYDGSLRLWRLPK